MTPPLGTKIDDQPSADEERVIQQGLVAFGDAHTPPRNYRPIRLALRTNEGKVIGGMLGSIVWNWLQIDVLWVTEDARGLGHGRALLERAEQLAREAGCRHARLDTFDFEARGFYEKLGYSVYGELVGFPGGHSQFHLRKTFANPAG